ncbi:hypothetical protein BD414DRAFT_308131 [Trametes punicea]|nr:hypothetical protein BD414DRAFT_308131 [Trametes punicea]
MTQPSFPSIDHPFVRKFIAPMALFVWGFAWLALSVLIFIAGRFLPQIQPRPIVLRTRPRSPRVRSVPVSPISTPLELSPVLVVEAALTESPVSTPGPQMVPRTLVSPPADRSRAKKWSLSSVTLLGGPSPPRACSELPVINSVDASKGPDLEREAEGSPPSTPALSPRAGRGVRMPSPKMFKSISRRLSSKQKADAMSSPSSRSAEVLPLRRNSPALDEKNEPSMRGCATIDSSPRSPRPGNLPHERNISLSGEVFTTTFVNPFKLKSRKVRTPPVVDLTEPVSPSPQRMSAPRRMLTSVQLVLTSPKSHVRQRSQSQSQSRRSSMSSTSTAVSAFSTPSVLSSSSAGSPVAPRTQPYAAPYFAPLPLPLPSARASSRADADVGARKTRPAQRRAASLSPPLLRRPEPVAEESGEEDPPRERAGGGDERLSALGLKLGQLGLGRPPARARPQVRHRAAVSEGSLAMQAGSRAGMDDDLR